MDTIMGINVDAGVGGPLLASGKATTEGVAAAVRYKQLRDLIDTLEVEREELREVILAAADEFPGVKSFPAGDLIIRIGTTTRETVPAAKVRTERPDLYEALTAAGFVNKSTAKTLSIK
jgi:hypothetical protein